jgi:hypothetical protein
MLFASNLFYILIGIARYADVVLAFFLLSAMVCIRHRDGNNGWLIMLAGACLGCGMWTKNEGIILAIIFITFYARSLFAGGNYRYFLAGIIVPLLTLVTFKIGYAPPNDMMSGQKAGSLQQLFDPERYKLIYKYLVDNISSKYYWVGIGVIGYLVTCVLSRRWPGRQFFLLFACFAAYFMVYIFSVEGLEWHLGTSQDRLLLQLMPGVVYVSAMGVADFVQERMRR